MYIPLSKLSVVVGHYLLILILIILCFRNPVAYGRDDRTAVVIGGGHTGQLAARVASEKFSTVYIIEADTFPFGAEPRKGVPQSNMVHLLLSGGWKIIQKLYPGIEHEMRLSGVPDVGWHDKVQWLNPFGFYVESGSRFTTPGASRPFLDKVIRDRTLKLPNVFLLSGTRVSGLITDSQGKTVLGVRFSGVNPNLGKNYLEADLVIDASGGTVDSKGKTKAVQRLEAIGYSAPRTLELPANLQYSNLKVMPPAGMEPEKTLYYIQIRPDHERIGAVLTKYESGWNFMLGELGGGKPPKDTLENMRSYIAKVTGHTLHELLQGWSADPTWHEGKPHVYAYDANRWRLFHQMKRWPERFIILGDGIARFNPAFGMGLSVSAAQAFMLKKYFRIAYRSGRNRNFARSFQRRVPRTIDLPWLISTTEDWRVLSKMQGIKPPLFVQGVNWGFDKGQLLGTRSVSIKDLLMAIFHLEIYTGISTSLRVPLNHFEDGQLALDAFSKLTRKCSDSQ